MVDVQLTDLNEAFGKALLQQFFEPQLMSRAPDGSAQYAPSGVSMLAQDLFRQHTKLIMDEVWEKIDVEELANKVSEKVVTELLRAPRNYYDPKNVQREKLLERVLEITAQQLGQRVVDQLDLQLGPKELEATDG